MRTSTTIDLDSGTYEEVLGQTVGAEDFDADATVSLAQHNTSRKHRSQARSQDVEAVLVATAEDAAFGAKGLDFQTAGLLEKRLLHTSDLSADAFHALDEGQAEGGLNERAIPGRYDVLDVLGGGASGQVFAAEDNNLHRQVAVKFLHPEDAADGDKMARFVKEAQVTSTLEHPNILPVFDFDLTDGGLAYFTMRKASGTTLFDAIKRSEREGRCVSEIATFNDRVAIMLKVCDAIGYAHDRGIIHQDIKPSNIMLGEHAAVVLVDWGTALTPEDRALDKVPLMGTPAYMAPEQARREGVDERSDVYCLGTTFFHLLTLRYPTWADDPDSFWEMKRAGIYQVPSESEQRMIPGALLDIALKAMAPDPQDRYATVDAMRRDLLNFQEGLSVSAHEDTLGELLRRWYRLNRKAVLVAAAALVLIAGLGAFFAWEKAKERSTWQPFASEGFDFDDSYKLERDWVGTGLPNWRADQAIPLPHDNPAWTLEDGRLVIHAFGRSADCVNLGYRRALPDNFRVRWTATPLERADNLNCFLGNRDRSDAYIFHVAGFNMPDSVTLTKGREIRMIERRRLRQPIQVGRSYRFQLERHETRVSLAIDGQVVLAYDDPDMTIGPERNSFGFEVGRNRVAIDDVRIEYLPLAEKIEPIAVADSFYARHHYGEALEHYRRIRELYPDTAMATRAAYRIGRCLAGLERPDEAVAALSLFAIEHPRHPLAQHARFDMAVIAIKQEDWATVEAAMGELAAARPAAPLRRASLLLIEDYLKQRHGIGTPELKFAPDAVERLVLALDQLDGWQQRLDIERSGGGGAVVLRRTIGETLAAVGAHDVILERFAGEPGMVFDALKSMGRGEEAERRFADHPNLMARHLANSKRWAELLERYPQSEHALNALLALERYDEALSRFPDQERRIQRHRLEAEGRLEEALALADPQSTEWYDLLWRLGRYEETRGRTWRWRDWQLDIMQGRGERALADPEIRTGIHYTMAVSRLLIDAKITGDEAAAARWRETLTSLPALEQHDPFQRLVLPVVVDALDGDPAALQRAEADLRSRYAKRFHGFVPAALDRLTGAGFPPLPGTGTFATTDLLDAVRHELADERDAAIEGYRAHLAQVEHWRPSARLATWRLGVLGAE